MDRSNFRLEVKLRSPTSVFFRWSIYDGADGRHPLKSSVGLYATKAEALAAGNDALADILLGMETNSEANRDR